MNALPPALAALGRWRQFVCWIALPSKTTPGKLDKLPVRWNTGEGANAHDPANWCSPEEACANHARWDQGHGSGVGFSFTEADPFFFLDIDGALQPDGTWSPLALDLCRTFNGAAVEVSVSGTGLHIIGCAKAVPHRKKNTELHLELYTSKRFVALTGTNAIGDCWTEHSTTFASVVAGLFAPLAASDFDGWTTEPVAEWGGPASDEALIARALRSKPRQTADTAFSNAAPPPSFEDLWTGNVGALAAYWPSTTGKPYDGSSADQALANNLAYFVGKNCERMERLMRQSALARDKWDVRPDYLADTILSACKFIRQVMNEPEFQGKAAKPGQRGKMSARDTAEYMDPMGQADHFDGCCYVSSVNAIFDPENGRLLGRQAFDVAKGGYLFIVDPLGKKTTESAFDAMTKSRVLAAPVADDICFRPEQEPGAMVHNGHQVLVNTYVPHDRDTAEGDVSPFMDFLARLVPDAHDRDILLHYMASLVQNPGVKFQWWPVLQGAEGNGKTLVLSALTYCVGEIYTHLPNAAAMARDGMKFNSWIHRKLFIGVEEIYTAERRSFLEEFKTVVTNERTGMEPKGMEQVTRDNRANGILCTNHRDGVPINSDTRRYAIIYTGQQSAEDIIRDGMGGEYFPALYDWFKSGGNRHVAHFLDTMELKAELDPARLLKRAPRTSSFRAAIHESRGKVELEILEAVDAGRKGFSGGFVSMTWVDDLIDRLRVHVPRTKRDALLEGLGFIPHPALTNARTTRAVQPDGCKARLFVREGHASLGLTDPLLVASAYERSQQELASDVAFGAAPAARP